MKLYSNCSARQQFTETVYELLSSDSDNYRANQIIDAYDSVPCVEPVRVHKCVFVSSERFRRLEADYEDLKQELMASKRTMPQDTETA